MTAQSRPAVGKILATRRLLGETHSLPQNHPILVVAHFILASVYSANYTLYALDKRFEEINFFFGRKIVRFETARMYHKALKEVLFALFHNWHSWWEPNP